MAKMPVDRTKETLTPAREGERVAPHGSDLLTILLFEMEIEIASWGF